MSLFQYGQLIVINYQQLKIYGPPTMSQFLKLSIRFFIAQHPYACIMYHLANKLAICASDKVYHRPIYIVYISE